MLVPDTTVTALAVMDRQVGKEADVKSRTFDPMEIFKHARRSPDESKSDPEVKQAVSAALSTLDDTSRWVLMSSFGLSPAPQKDVDEIASELDLPEAHVEAIQLKAFRALRTAPRQIIQ